MQLMLVPWFDAFARIGLFDTWAVMLVTYAVVALPFSAFVMRNFFSGIADSVFEAAVVDGANVWAHHRADVQQYPRRRVHPPGHLGLERPAAPAHPQSEPVQPARDAAAERPPARPG